MMRERWVIGGLLLAAVLLLVVDPSLAWRVQRLVRPSSEAAPNELAREHASLKAEIARDAALLPLQGRSMPAGVPAPVYSRYPFALKQELLVAAGSGDGVEEGWAAVVPAASSLGSAGVFFLGRVQSVFEDAALLRTIFDPRFQSAVRIGNAGTEGLLTGGTSPRITLIAKHAALREGDPVLIVAPEFPYGLTLGTVRDVRLAHDELFQEALLVPGYDINGIVSVLLLPHHAAQ